ncbi:hypothetical protein PSHT_15669 [Puccinia striiformis]|uniref:Uncharacterized protein n=1 Tax=Puccinia striiformis TaxID=27350 RepID=A0A2S4UDM3_9BASI|nr:hypothetical protein PSHT_15669 [Puccinia striiformis]
MPIELGIEADGTYGLGAYWEGDRAGICPEPNAARVLLDPEDLALLAEPPPAPGSSISITNGSSQNQTLTVQGASHPSASGSGSSIPSSVHIPDRQNPTDRPDQSSSMSNLPDVRLEHAIIRPMTPKVGGPRLAYFLPESSDGVKNYKRIKEEKKMIDEEDQADEDIKDGDPEAAPEPVNELRFVRDYEISQQRPLNQYLLIFDDGQASGRRKAAYFNPVGNFRTLRKRRPKPNEPAQFDGEEETPWDGISVLLSTDPGAISSIKAVRKELLAPVSQPSGL